ncbi:uncharacterized protein LOC120507544 [Passer montanus]|uniref:uncharacterized protein LOC120507544 n=1 Tax=Passer montanus TaxID=9160 RepID=UPI001961B549|nr:uncharacterized protein LOC120507544 [Passer montanus]
MHHGLSPLCPHMASHLLSLLIGKQPRWDLPALAFLVEVSLMASAAWLSCLPALWPLVAAAAWDAARARCCCLGPALCGSGLLPAMSPVTALCLSAPGVSGLEPTRSQCPVGRIQAPAKRVQGQAAPAAQRPRGAQQGALAGEKGAVAEAALAGWGWGTQTFGLGWALAAEAAAPSSPASRFSCPSAPSSSWCCSHSWLHSTASSCTQSGEIRGLYQHLLEQLADPDAEMVWMTLSVLTHVLQDRDHKIPSITTLKLAEAVLPHFDNVRLCAPSQGHWMLPGNFVLSAVLGLLPQWAWSSWCLGLFLSFQDNSQVQLLSIQLFSKVMELVVEKRDEPLTRIPAPRTPLPALGRVGRLGRCWAQGAPGRGAEPAPSLRSPQLLQDESQVAEQLRWALPRLQSPQRPLREVAVRIIGERRPFPPPGPAAAPAAGAAPRPLQP